jgi:hypothetical protein
MILYVAMILFFVSAPDFGSTPPLPEDFDFPGGISISSSIESSEKP